MTDRFAKFNRLLSFVISKGVKAFIYSASTAFNSRMQPLSGLTPEQYNQLKKYVILGGEKGSE